MTSGAPYLLIDAGNSRIKWTMVHANRTQLASGALTHGGDDSPDWSTLPTPCGAWLSNVAGEKAAARIAALLDAQQAAIKPIANRVFRNMTFLHVGWLSRSDTSIRGECGLQNQGKGKKTPERGPPERGQSTFRIQGSKPLANNRS